MTQTISMIAALGNNRVIGNENKLICHIPEDMRRMKELTTGKPLIMGRKTHESIGRPLPNRKNIIITRDKSYKSEGCVVVHSMEDALKAAEGPDEIIIFGGGEIYKMFLPVANKLYLTTIEKDFEGDAYFPEYGEEWKIIGKEEHENKDFKYSFLTLEKK